MKPHAPGTSQHGLCSLADILASLPNGQAAMLPVATARTAMSQCITPITDIEWIGLRDGLGRVLAQDIDSPIDVPAHDNSAMDGWALRAIDLHASEPTRLQVIGAAHAGSPYAGPVDAHQAVRIMTGAVMPAGCDTVVIQESACVDGDSVLIPAGQQAGQNRRLKGEDLSRGRPAVLKGRQLRASDLGLLASLGIAEIPVLRPLRVAFFSTGNELRSLGQTLDPGCIYDSNRYTLHGMLSRLGVELIDLGVVPDEPQALESALRGASLQADAIISSGGVSVGEADFTRAVMSRTGEVAFWTIAMRPGRPMAFGRVGSAAYFGLPGNPVAVMVTFLFLVRDALIQLGGGTPRPLLPMRVRSAHPIRKRPGRTEYQRAVIEIDDHGDWVARIAGNQGSGVLRSMSEANAMVVLAHDQGDVAPGQWVEAIAFEGLL
jgi:molybdopterin molybdotransferase